MHAEDRLKEFEQAMDRLKKLVIDNIFDMWIEYDKQNDILYIGFGREEAEESVMVDNDIVVGIKSDRLVGITIFDFSRKTGLE